MGGEVGLETSAAELVCRTCFSDAKTEGETKVKRTLSVCPVRYASSPGPS